MNICNLGCGNKVDLPFRGINKENYDDWIVLHNVDRRELLRVTYQIDLSNPRWPLEGSLYDYVVAEHVAEHMPNRIAFLQECVRITREGGTIIIEVPSWK